MPIATKDLTRARKIGAATLAYDAAAAAFTAAKEELRKADAALVAALGSTPTDEPTTPPGDQTPPPPVDEKPAPTIDPDAP